MEEETGWRPRSMRPLTRFQPLVGSTDFENRIFLGGGAEDTGYHQLVVDPATGQRLLAYPTSALGDNGVFPLEVDLRSAADESLAHFVTHVVVAPVGADGTLTVGQPLNLAWVWPLQAEPAYLEVAGIAPINPTTLQDLEPNGRLGRLRRRFPGADAVVFGHSHLPLHEAGDGFQIFNPGSPTDRRRAPGHTMGIATARDGRLDFELVALD